MYFTDQLLKDVKTQSSYGEACEVYKSQTEEYYENPIVIRIH